MQLSVQSQKIGDIVVVRCQGRITVGAEVASLQSELEKLTVLTKKVVLQLGEVSFVDSVGLGALVRQFSVLRSKGGDLKLCQVSPILLQVLQVTSLHRVFPIHASEEEAVLAFTKGTQFQEETLGASKTRIVCIDPSHDLLAYLSALLKRSGYEVMTTRNPSDAQSVYQSDPPASLDLRAGHSGQRARDEGIRRDQTEAGASPSSFRFFHGGSWPSRNRPGQSSPVDFAESGVGCA
jgi:anti-sigma B factor antagonist